jgi:hypothetical protein
VKNTTAIRTIFKRSLGLVLALLAGFVAVSFLGALIFMGWGAVIPAQVQITLDRRGMKQEDFVAALEPVIARLGFERLPSQQGGRAVFMESVKGVFLEASRAPSDIDHAMINVVDRMNQNRSIEIAKSVATELHSRFPVERIYVQLDHKQYDCERSGCSFELGNPIEASKIPRWFGQTN